MKQADLLKRVDELLAIRVVMGTEMYITAYELSQGCVSLLSLVYGEKSSRVQEFNSSVANLPKDGHRYIRIAAVAQGALRNLKSEVQAGLTVNLKHQIAGEVLTDFIQLARSVLNEQGDGAKNVAAVLAAAAFEDTLRRMGENLAGVVGKDDLSEVLKKLKDGGTIQSPQVGIAQSYLSFRNHALHANWDTIQRESIHSALGFVEQLLMKHFS